MHYIAQIKAAFVFGSVAKRSDKAASDIDVLVLSDTLEYADLFAAFANLARIGKLVAETGNPGEIAGIMVSDTKNVKSF